jgi:rhodanese-related sulfurtransferase
MARSITLEAMAGLDKDGFTLVDVRRQKDYEKGGPPIPGALRQDPETTDWDLWAGDQAEKELTIVYCVRGGPVSQAAADRIEQAGGAVSFLEGGLEAWEKGKNRDEG